MKLVIDNVTLNIRANVNAEVTVLKDSIKIERTSCTVSERELEEKRVIRNYRAAQTREAKKNAYMVTTVSKICEPTSVAKALREHLKANGMSYVSFAKENNLSGNNLWAWENGRSGISEKSIKKLINAGVKLGA